MGEDPFLNLQPGTVVNGRYEIIKCLGTGSMGMVYACRHLELSGHLVAMKVLFAEVARDNVAAQRFRNEIVASYGVSNPNVVRAYEYFRDGDLIGFTMEYISGGDLADRISAEDPIPLDEIVVMLRDMSSGAQAIHDAGIIHRDLKPENILLTVDGKIKITDFGIARTGHGPKLTEHGGVVGTIDYVSPEYLERGQVDERSDIYALGVLAYEMITGEAPFKGKSVIETMTLRLRTDPPNPKVIRPACPDKLAEIVVRAMARDPEERYQSAQEVFDDLESIDLDDLPNETPGQEFQFDDEDDEDTTISSLPSVADIGPDEKRGDRTPTVITVSEDDDVEYEDEPRRGRYVASGGTTIIQTVEDLGEAEEEHLAPLESLLSPNKMRESMEEEAEGHPVSVSHGKLPADRMRELSQHLYADEPRSIKKTLSAFFLVIVSFGFFLWLFGGVDDEESILSQTPSKEASFE